MRYYGCSSNWGGGDPNQVPSVGEFFKAFGIISMGSCPGYYVCHFVFLLLFYFLCVFFSLCTVPVLMC